MIEDGAGPVRLIFMIDGLGPDYLESGASPYLSHLLDEAGEVVQGIWPTVTNVNNAAIACAAPPSATGITGNSFLDVESGQTMFMDSSAMLRMPSKLETWSKAGRHPCLLTAKGKTERLLGVGVDDIVNSEQPSAELVREVGPPPPIYSSAVNLWLFQCLSWLIEHRRDIDTFYLHTTDYPMHMWAPNEDGSKEHLRLLDEALRSTMETLPDAEVYLTADHGMNAKSRALDLGRILAARGIEGASALSIEKDGYVDHHRDLGGGAWVWAGEDERDRVADLLRELEGVEQVIPRAEAAAVFMLDPTRMGDLAVLGDRRTVFGDLPTEVESLAPGYRSHGSLYEREVPLLRWGTSRAASTPTTMNWHLLQAVDEDEDG